MIAEKQQVMVGLDPTRPASASLDALGLIAVPLQPSIEKAMGGFDVRLEMSNAPGLVVARIESCCPPILLIDTELLGCPTDLCRFARSLRPDVKVVALACYWSEREEALRACADAVLHYPPRDREWRTFLTRCGICERKGLVAAVA